MWEGVVWFRKRELLAFGAYAYEVVCGFIRMLFLDKRGHRKSKTLRELLVNVAKSTEMVCWGYEALHRQNAFQLSFAIFRC